ncbi:hypothetical protein J5Y04_03515 [Kitasatospora sp. RG8]|uniref:hypothetical protein n=1 Tax=Kitasatospora sp. RG8 TaxID=2820815 RepID=UPI001AE09FAB|nr:hypothetical protein [Kitasatospora sp. RG8]MBP0448612.1 hypothetical protein [Kitasatospora sp. RG8]
MHGQELAAAAVGILVDSAARGTTAGSPDQDVVSLVRERLGRTQLGTAALFRLDGERSSGAADIVRSVLADEISGDAAFGQMLQAAVNGRPPLRPAGPPVSPPPPHSPPTQPPPVPPPPLPPRSPAVTHRRPPAAAPSKVRPRPSRGRVVTVWLLGLPQLLVVLICESIAVQLDAPSAVVPLLLGVATLLTITGITLGAGALQRSSSLMLHAGVMVDAFLLLSLVLRFLRA